MRPESPLRPVAPPADPAAAAALGELAARLRADLGAALADEAAPSYEELEAYVDGRMGADEAEAFAARAADDPLLAAEVEDLVRLRDRLSRSRRPAGTRWVWAAAAALALALAGALTDGSGWRRPQVADGDVPSAEARQAIFVDSFESGDLAAWRD